MIILVINSGSSSIKFQLIQTEGHLRLCAGLLERIGFEEGVFTYDPEGKEKLKRNLRIADHSHGINLVLGIIVDPRFGVLHSVGQIGAVGHRVVHGGRRSRRPSL